MAFILDVGIKLDNRHFGGVGQVTEIDKRLKRAVDIYSESSGCGFGVRDHQYRFASEEEAEVARQAIGRIFFEREIDYISIYKEEAE